MTSEVRNVAERIRQSGETFESILFKAADHLGVEIV